jgi:hypothetical protein
VLDIGRDGGISYDFSMSELWTGAGVEEVGRSNKEDGV